MLQVHCLSCGYWDTDGYLVAGEVELASINLEGLVPELAKLQKKHRNLIVVWPDMLLDSYEGEFCGGRCDAMPKVAVIRRVELIGG